MALVSNIVIDLSSLSAVLTITKLANHIETITYSSNKLTFSQRNLINITGVEFLDLISQINIFQSTLLGNFSVNLKSTPFNSVNCTETNDVVNNKWNLVCLFGALPRVVNYSADGASKTVDLLNRANSKTIEFPEWIYLLYALNHYKESVKSFFNL